MMLADQSLMSVRDLQLRFYKIELSTGIVADTKEGKVRLDFIVFTTFQGQPGALYYYPEQPRLPVFSICPITGNVFLLGWVIATPPPDIFSPDRGNPIPVAA